ncbi:hypothetical protein D3C87_1764770 [compost metagenome]
MVEKTEQRFLLFIAAIGIEIVRNLPILGIGRFIMPYCLMYGCEERNVLLDHFLLCTRSAGFKFQYKITFISSLFDALRRSSNGKRRDARHFFVPVRKPGPVSGRHHFIELLHAVFLRVKQPRSIVHAHEGVQCECLPQVLIARDFLSIRQYFR